MASLMFRRPETEALYRQHFARDHLHTDRIARAMLGFASLSYVHATAPHVTWPNTVFQALLSAEHFVMLWCTLTRAPGVRRCVMRHREAIVTAERMANMVAYMHGQYWLFISPGDRAAQLHILAFGSLVQPFWLPLAYRVRFNLCLWLSTLQLCVNLATNGLIVPLVMAKYGAQLAPQAQALNSLAHHLLGLHPGLTAETYFAAVWCVGKQVAALLLTSCYAVLLKCSCRVAVRSPRHISCSMHAVCSKHACNKLHVSTAPCRQT